MGYRGPWGKCLGCWHRQWFPAAQCMTCCWTLATSCAVPSTLAVAGQVCLPSVQAGGVLSKSCTLAWLAAASRSPVLHVLQTGSHILLLAACRVSAMSDSL